MASGYFVTIEGIEGSGKSTLAQAIRAAFESSLQVILTREPGGTEIGAQIRKVLLSPENAGLTPGAELLLFAADRAQHVAQKIKPAIESGALVICDRFTHSTLAYQGYGRGMDLAVLDRLNEIATAGLRPDLVLLLDLDVESGMGRIQARNPGGKDRIEQQEIEFHHRVRNGFLELSKRGDAKFVVLDAKAAPEKLAQQAIENIAPLMKK